MTAAPVCAGPNPTAEQITMAQTLFFAAHDTGGGRVLKPIIEAYQRTEYKVIVWAKGPAEAILTYTPWDRSNVDPATILKELSPTVVVTGTSASANFESDIWAAARELGIPSVAILDASINLYKRFVAGQPDLACVVDNDALHQLKEIPGFHARINVVGQPHLERIRRLIGPRKDIPRFPPQLVYFSEPCISAPGETHPIGYEQFIVAEALLPGLANFRGLTLTIKPHPNETTQHWLEWRNRVDIPTHLNVKISISDSIDLMRRTHGVLGLGSMALIEAALGGIPVLALQPGRRYCPNPRLDAHHAIQLITDPEMVVAATQEFVQAVMTDGNAEVTVDPTFVGSTTRATKVIDEYIVTDPRTRTLETYT